MGAVIAGDIAQDLGGRADAMKLLGRRILYRGICLQQDSDRSFLPYGFLCRSDGLWPADRDRVWTSS